MTKTYLRPEIENYDFLPDNYLCATSDRDGNLSDYNLDDETNFFSGL